MEKLVNQPQNSVDTRMTTQEKERSSYVKTHTQHTFALSPILYPRSHATNEARNDDPVSIYICLGEHPSSNTAPQAVEFSGVIAFAEFSHQTGTSDLIGGEN
ncbi:hypothetical protein BaRGS_00031008 [Batillaria attramentaria]|uniref:Uncharacterized protein n=1 Tax=Batillaria attramentaria TaxID=370345 RepID=A0ABD0JSR4_9CAEN